MSYVSELTVYYRIDNKDWTVLDMPINAYLKEVMKSLPGINKGQSIQFKFAWIANGATEIHKFVCEWQPLRELNI